MTLKRWQIDMIRKAMAAHRTRDQAEGNLTVSVSGSIAFAEDLLSNPIGLLEEVGELVLRDIQRRIELCEAIIRSSNAASCKARMQGGYADILSLAIASVICVLIALILTSCARQTFVAWENDFFSPVNHDEQYTQGLRLSSVDPINSSGNYNGYEAGQIFFTPRNKRTSELQADDRPYAGWVFAGINQHSKGDELQETLGLKFGCIGPCSGAEHTQRWVHKLIDNTDPQGWHHQLGNEPTVMGSLDRFARWPAIRIGKVEGELITGVGVDLGTPYTQAAITGLIRFGVNLPEDYGPRHILSRNFAPNLKQDERSDFGAYFFIGTEDRAVAYNSFLDGNLFRTSHSVDSKPLVVEGRVGVSVRLWRARITFSYARISQEYEERSGDHGYGLVTFSYE